MIEPVDPARFELLHMLMACANSASAIFEFYGPISPAARNFESIFKYVPFTFFSLYIEFACTEEGRTSLLLAMLLRMAFLI